MAIDYVTYVQLPSEATGSPSPWHRIRSSLIRGEGRNPAETQLRSYDLARSIYPLYPLRTVAVEDRISYPPETPPPETMPARGSPELVNVEPGACASGIYATWPPAG